MTEQPSPSAAGGKSERVAEQSAAWVCRIQAGEVTNDNADELKRWLAEDEEHARSFQRMLDVFERSGTLGEFAGLHHAETPAPVNPRSVYRPLMAAAATVLILGAFSLLSLFDAERIRTATGERRLVNLEDGSSIHLNVESSVSVSLGSRQRTVELTRGEVLFDVAGDSTRPFVVNTGSLDITVTGTSFQVTRYDDRTTVAVVEGTVNVATGDERGLSLAAGEGVRLDDSGLHSIGRFDADRLTGWRQGWLYLDDVPVRDLVARLDRQFHGDIGIEDRELADSRISIALKLQRREETLERVEMLLPLRVNVLPGERFIVEANP